MPPARESNRLNDRSMHLVPAAVRRPAYDRAQLRISMAHVGVGAFHRCHQAEHTEDAIEAGSTECGVVGINLRPTLLVPSLGLQDGLYSRTLREGDSAETRVIGCIRQVVDADKDVEGAVAALASPTISVTTMTITEKGYCPDEAHPDVIPDLPAAIAALGHRPARRRYRLAPSVARSGPCAHQL